MMSTHIPQLDFYNSGFFLNHNSNPSPHVHVRFKKYIQNIFTIINSYQKQYRSPNSTAAPSAANSLTGLWNVGEWNQ